MRLFLIGYFLFLSLPGNAQDTAVHKWEQQIVRIFNSEKAINVTTTELTGQGKMAFKVTHNFGDIAGKGGGIKQFFGLDNSTDIRIAFEIGIGRKSDIILARAKGAGLQQQLFELGFKYKLMEQAAGDPGHPVSIAVLGNIVAAANKANSFPNQDNSYDGFGDRLSNLFQLIIAKKIGKVSTAVNTSFLRRGYAVSYDQENIFAVGAAIKVPIIENRFNFLVDYIHPFRKDAVADSFKVNDNIKFYDPLGIGFEFITSGHHFRLNFTNTTEILENRFLPRTISSWGKGQFRWSFTISRNFRLWTPK